jgi:hypothetical protein
MLTRKGFPSDDWRSSCQCIHTTRVVGYGKFVSVHMQQQQTWPVAVAPVDQTFDGRDYHN